MRHSFIIVLLVVCGVILPSSVAAAGMRAGEAIRVDGAHVAQLTPRQTDPQERDIVEPEPVRPGEATPRELGIVEREPLPEPAPAPPDPVVGCGPGEVRYGRGCIPAPNDLGEPLGVAGECPPGFFEYRGRCHQEPDERDIRIPPDEGPAPATQRQRQEEQCQMAFEACLQQCEPHRTHGAMYENCVNTCNVGYTNCLQQ